MTTTIPLSDEDKQIVQVINSRQIDKSRGAIGIGTTVIIVGVLLYCSNLNSRPDEGFTVISILALAFGGLMIAIGLFRVKYYKKADDLSQYITEKNIVTGTLQSVEIKNNKLHYNLAGFTIELIPNIHAGNNYNMQQPYLALLHRDITLEYIQLPFDENLLLRVFYATETPAIAKRQPITEEEKRQLRTRWDYLIAPSLAIFVGFFVSLANDFSPKILPYTIGLPLALTAVIMIPWLKKIKQSEEKLVMTTRITEAVTLRVGSGKNVTYPTWYRIDTGELINFGIADFNVGERITVAYFINKNGTTGSIIRIKTVSA